MRDADRNEDRPAHPTLAAGVLMCGIVVLLVLLAVLGAR